ncbi:phosphopantothenoylcysteine decarboxylase/phosphopantothenate--cysteine ligase [Azospirillum agricola]|uniref:bifunctional phosphopantothenoylcysteine decarboxylase/phosphopantothenate--cysteine ligase CoaBC n=1 Tax=Azospirillum agricola TaxID=1720247 RepID=UPI001AEB7BB5|nr:bifunctional phosphopantothenoylcysteine decarboxylase/phosphopantothenate--cysteine ligase CoaBC [Azospirillum agricola]MBP2229727.1 phosphopantothenoylcysteine decarboxylase/phosphopantothenate--cysteine ligase [Azospirillum agricola]
MADHAILSGKRVLLVIAGGIAAYKCLDLIRRLRERGVSVRAVLTAAGARFVTPLSVQALTENTVYQDLWSLTDESEMGHIQLSRAADLVVVAPATADLLARMAAGMADDLAATVLLATDKPVLVAPAMNVRMWLHPATQANMELLERRGVLRVGPNDGVMACNEFGPGRMAEPMEIIDAIAAHFAADKSTAHFAADKSAAPATADAAPKPLAGKRAIVTSGPTHEPIDPVRYIANRSSGKQGHAIAKALAQLGAAVTLVSGPTRLADPPGCTVVAIETAREMLAACEAALPADIAVCAAAVADWRVAGLSDRKLKKDGGGPPTLALTENPDILATLSQAGERRPALVVGFAAETGDVIAYATAKRARKGCDWIVANDVSLGTTTFGGADNTVHLIREGGVESWPTMGKDAVAARLADAIAERFRE